VTHRSLQTTIAWNVLTHADGQLAGHRKGCFTCRQARFPEDYCPAGWQLSENARDARVTARASAELDRQVPDGQEAMF
jgi:hypothetical protein